MANPRTSPAVSPYVHLGRYKFPHLSTCRLRRGGGNQPLIIIPVQTLAMPVLPSGLCLPCEENGTEIPQQNGRGNAYHQIQRPASNQAVIATHGD